MFVRGAVPLLLVLSIALAPVALDACQASCAVDAVAAMSGTAHAAHHEPGHKSASSEHACHDAMIPAPLETTTTIAGLPHACGHTGDLPPTSAAAAQLTLHAPAVLPALFELDFAATASRERAPAANPPDSVPISAPIPLRV